MLVALKKLNRLEKVRSRAGREALHKEKQRVDSTHLLLQNLLYEADHLNKEVTKCFQFKSKDEEIELVPVKEFYKSAPPDIARPVSLHFIRFSYSEGLTELCYCLHCCPYVCLSQIS